MFPQHKGPQQQRRLLMQLGIGEILFQRLGQSQILPLNRLALPIHQFRQQRRADFLVGRGRGQPHVLGQRRCQIAIHSRRPDRPNDIHVQFYPGMLLIQVDQKVVNRSVDWRFGFFSGRNGKVFRFRQPVFCRVINLLRQIGYDGLDNELRFRLERRLKVAGRRFRLRRRLRFAAGRQGGGCNDA